MARVRRPRSRRSLAAALATAAALAAVYALGTLALALHAPRRLARTRSLPPAENDWAELLGALVLTAGMWTVALLTWRDVRAGERDRFTRGLLAVSAAVLVATMLLALSWALGGATGPPHPNLTWMAATHGLGNALGFALCSVLAWRRLKEKAA